MIYRFAVSSFWSAMLWADLLPFKLGEIKGLVNRNIRWWMQKKYLMKRYPEYWLYLPSIDID